MAINPHVAVVYSKNYRVTLGGVENLHPFDIRKYERIYLQLVADNIIKPGDVYVPEQISDEDILRVQTQGFLDSLGSSRTVAKYLEAPVVGLLPSALVKKSVLRPFRYATGGTLLAARQALTCGVAINIGGGYHHAMPSTGEGFCIYADIPIAISKLRSEKKIRRVLIIDLDVHQGNGTAVCLDGDDEALTFSMHQGDIYPMPKARSDLDIELAGGTGDKDFLRILADNLDGLFDRAKPDIVFYVAGCDTLADDPLASLEMTQQGIVRRDAMVIDACVKRKIPAVMTLGGGYSPNAWRAQYASIRNIVETHACSPN